MAVNVPPNYYNVDDNIGTLRVAQITVPLTPVLLAPYQANRTRASIQNIGANVMFIGTDATLTVTNGYKIGVNGAFTIFNSCEIWGVAITGATIASIALEQTS